MNLCRLWATLSWYLWCGYGLVIWCGVCQDVCVLACFGYKDVQDHSEAFFFGIKDNFNLLMASMGSFEQPAKPAESISVWHSPGPSIISIHSLWTSNAKSFPRCTPNIFTYFGIQPNYQLAGNQFVNWMHVHFLPPTSFTGIPSEIWCPFQPKPLYDSMKGCVHSGKS